MADGTVSRTRIADIFKADELERARNALSSLRAAGGYEPGRWMVSPLNRLHGGFASKGRVALRDITLRTIEQMPGVINSPAERTSLLVKLATAGVPEVVVSAFRRGHPLESICADIAAAKKANPSCEIVYANAVNAADMDFAYNAGIDAVQVWSIPWLGDLLPVTAGAVYHRHWQGRDWRDLKFPTTEAEHIARSERLVTAGAERGVRVSGTVNVLAYATEDYVAKYCARVAEAGAYEVVLADSSGGTGPEAIAHLVRVAHEAAPSLQIGVHLHNLFGLAVASSLAAARAGAAVLEVSVNGYETGPAGAQASLAACATALEALYGVDTGIDLAQMDDLSKHAEAMTHWPVAWSEPLVGSGCLESANADEYEMEAEFDELIHSSIVAETVGARRRRRVGSTTGPLGMRIILDGLGVPVPDSALEPIREACLTRMRRLRRPLSDDEVRDAAVEYATAQSAQTQ
jgi:isopropylmalate/homocitrate/citramalate synthase